MLNINKLALVLSLSGATSIYHCMSQKEIIDCFVEMTRVYSKQTVYTSKCQCQVWVRSETVKVIRLVVAKYKYITRDLVC